MVRWSRYRHHRAERATVFLVSSILHPHLWNIDPHVPPCSNPAYWIYLIYDNVNFVLFSQVVPDLAALSSRMT